jgi:hypothetical protein
VHDVVADLHVLEDLGHAQADGAEHQGRGEQDAAVDHAAAGDFEAAL